MANLLKRCLDAGDICIYRGDTAKLIFNLKDSTGAAFDGTGRTYLLSVNSLEEPPDGTTQIFQVAGVVATTQVSFTPTTPNVANVISAFFDIQETAADATILTIAKGAFLILQDVTK